jgi:hypothetical protein
MEWGCPVNNETALRAKYICSEAVGALEFFTSLEADRAVRSSAPTFQLQQNVKVPSPML